jgi:uncharacterized protein YbaP (TraB family)
MIPRTIPLHRRCFLALAPALAALSACALPPDPAIDAAAAAELARRPDHYTHGEARAVVVSRHGRPCGLLWGTWHVGYDEATVMPRPVRAAFAAARRVVVEQVLDRMPQDAGDAMADLARHGLEDPDPAALRRLDPLTRQGLADAGVTPADLHGNSLLGLAWLVGGRAVPATAGLLPQVGFVDLNLIGFARSIGTPVEGLEEPDPGLFRRLFYADPNGADAAAALRLALRRRAGAGAGALLGWVRARYQAGQVGTLLAGQAGWMAEPADLRRADVMRGPLLAQRNLAWLPRLEAALDAPGLTFAAFGAAHLTGTDGVVALLAGRGWMVQPCVGDRVPALDG